jgi:tetraacyldisaccharide 4'-kinase
LIPTPIDSSGDHYRALVSGQLRGVWPELQRGGLWLASGPYGWAMRLRNWFYDLGWKERHRVGIPVVCVGNLTVGGTGKTPCVEYVARYYRLQNRRVAIVSRGYGGDGGRNDEALVLEEQLPDVPHLQGADRVALAQIAVEELESEVLVLDDGLQHRRLHRDLDIVLLDATNPWGHGFLLPRGLLREPRQGLRRAGVVMMTRCDQVDAVTRERLREDVARFAPGMPMAEATHRPIEFLNDKGNTESVTLLQGRPVAAFCGIGNPKAFRRTLADLGAHVEAFRVFPDHHPYIRADVDELQRWAEQQVKDCVLVTTQKDLVKLRLPRLGGRPLWALRIGLHFEAGQEALDRKLQEVLTAGGS